MKEWILVNTSVKEDTYDQIITSHQKKQEVSLEQIFANPKKLRLLTINEFTKKEPTKKHLEAFDVKKIHEGYEYQGIKFAMLSSYMPDSDLLSDKRNRKCHSMSLRLAQVTDFDVVTALCVDYHNCELLHTFLVKEGIVIDYTMNSIMAKEDYYDLMDVKEIKILKNEQAKELFLLLNENHITSEINDAEIVCFPEEIVLSLKRKKEV